MIVFQQEERGYTVFLNDMPANKQLSMLEFGYSRIREGVVVGPRIRNDYVLHFVLQGTGKFEDVEIRAGEGFLICPGKLHSFSVDPEVIWEHCWIAFSGNGVKKLLTEYGIEETNQIFSFSGLEQFRKDVERLRRVEEVTELTLAAFFYYMLSLRTKVKVAASPSGELPGEYVEKAVSLIRSSYMDPVKIKDLAEKINISQKYLWKIFKKQLGISPQAYLLGVRMETAVKYLRSTRLSVAEIARSVGYTEPISFIQNFKKYTGRTPTEFRRNPEK